MIMERLCGHRPRQYASSVNAQCGHERAMPLALTRADSSDYFVWPGGGPSGSTLAERVLAALLPHATVAAVGGGTVAATSDAASGETAQQLWIAHDSHVHREMLLLAKLVRAYPARSVKRLFFDEVEPTSPQQYVAPHARRYEHLRWGVLHMARFSMEPRQQQASTTGAAQQPPTVAPPRMTPAPVASEAGRMGYCHTTEWSEGDCFRGDKGSFPVGRLESHAPNIADLTDCVSYCRDLCPRCAYISFSRQQRECSWFAECDLKRLHTEPRDVAATFRSFAMA